MNRSDPGRFRERQRTVHRSVAAGSIFSVLLVLSVTAAAEPFCSKGRNLGTRPPQYFIGQAMADTVLVEPGDTEPRVGGGHFGRSGFGPFHGQVVRVERFGTRTGLDVARYPEVIVMPWDYDASCGPVRWGRSAAFVEPGTIGLYTPHLRPEADWEDGTPTFDSYAPEMEAYPFELQPDFMRSFESRPHLSAEELFELLERLPSREELDASAGGAADPFFDWVQNQERLETHYPLTDAAYDLRRSADRAWARSLPVPIAGTYRVEVELPSGAMDVFYLRTASRPQGAWRPELGRPPHWQRYATGYQLFFWHAGSEADLPTSPNRNQRADWPLAVAAEGVETADAISRSGHMEMWQLDHAIGPNSELSEFREAWSSEFSPDVDTGGLAFVQSAVGDLTFRVVFDVDDGRRIIVRGVRVSTRRSKETAGPAEGIERLEKPPLTAGAGGVSGEGAPAAAGEVGREGVAGFEGAGRRPMQVAEHGAA